MREKFFVIKLDIFSTFFVVELVLTSLLESRQEFWKFSEFWLDGISNFAVLDLDVIAVGYANSSIAFTHLIHLPVVVNSRNE